jgi:CheY-like chemotaxis protein
MPDDEQLKNLRALSAGMHTALDYFLQRLARYHELLDVELDERSSGRQYLTEANASLARAQETLAAFSRALVDEFEGFESFDLALLAQGMATRISRVSPIALDLDISQLNQGEAFIRGNLFLMQQVMFDLPRLIAPAPPQSSNLHLSVTHQRYDESYFRNRKTPLKSGDYYEVTVALAGQAPVEREALIALNERLAMAPTLALADRLLFVYGVVREHGGELFARKGTGPLDQLTLLLPAQLNRAAMYTEPDLEDAELHGDETILLVDDEAIIWDVVIDMLQGMGYTVILAADGRDCVEIYRDNPGEIDLVLLDMVMPEMNGKDAFFALKELDPEVKVLLQSGYIKEEDAQDVLDAGAKGFLRKPYRMHELARRIRGILD